MFKVTTLDTEFELLPDESLLAGLERTHHAVEYQCRSGYCGSCRVKLLAGVVSGDADGVCCRGGDFSVLLRVGNGCGGGVLFAG